MTAGPSKGTCLLCGVRYRRTQMADHLAWCQRWAIGPRKLLHVVVGRPGDTTRWLHLAADLSATLADIDDLIQGAWPECAGEERRFIIAKVAYRSSPAADDPDGRTMSVPLGTVLAPGQKLGYESDVGSATIKLVLDVVVERKGAADERQAWLLARSDAWPVTA